MDGGYMLPMTAPDRCAVLIRRVAARQQAVTRVAPPDGPISDA
jgi:hypothetical protein